MACAFYNESDSGLPRKYDGLLNIASLGGLDNVNGVSCCRAWGDRTGQAGVIVIVDRDGVTSVERRIGPLVDQKGA